MKRSPGRKVGAALAAALLAVAAGCHEAEPVRSPETLAVQAKAGDFLDYYEEVLKLSRRYAAFPDSFRVALDSLPGSHLTDEEWKAWTEPYVEESGPLAKRLEQVLADMSKPVGPAQTPAPPTRPPDVPEAPPPKTSPGDAQGKAPGKPGEK